MGKKGGYAREAIFSVKGSEFCMTKYPPGPCMMVDEKKKESQITIKGGRSL